MSKYQVKYIASDGESWVDDEVFDTEEEAFESGEYGCGCHSLGNEIFNLSNPGDYPLDEDDELEFEVIEIED